MNKEEYQTQYFKFIHINYPSLLYNDILVLMSEKYHPTKNLLKITIIKLKIKIFRQKII